MSSAGEGEGRAKLRLSRGFPLGLGRTMLAPMVVLATIEDR